MEDKEKLNENKPEEKVDQDSKKQGGDEAAPTEKKKKMNDRLKKLGYDLPF